MLVNAIGTRGKRATFEREGNTKPPFAFHLPKVVSTGSREFAVTPIRFEMQWRRTTDKLENMERRSTARAVVFVAMLATLLSAKAHAATSRRASSRFSRAALRDTSGYTPSASSRSLPLKRYLNRQ